jgi:hypothetical protein
MARWLLVVGLVSLAFTWMRFASTDDVRPKPKPRNWLKELHKAVQDPQEMDRLIAEEARRNPAGHRQLWAKAALERRIGQIR